MRPKSTFIFLAIAIGIALLLVLSSSAQTAKVAQLSPMDADKARSLYEKRDAILKQLADLNVQIEHEYISNMEMISGCVNLNQGVNSIPCHEPKQKIFTLQPGWENGFEYSDNFKFIVPKPMHGLVGGYCGNGCVTTAPYIMQGPAGSISY